MTAHRPNPSATRRRARTLAPLLLGLALLPAARAVEQRPQSSGRSPERVLVVKRDTGAPGTTLVIRGGPFGPERGEFRVMLLEEVSGSSTKPRRVELQILEWRTNEVHARIPELAWRVGGRFAIVIVDGRTGTRVARSSSHFTLGPPDSRTPHRDDRLSSRLDRAEPRPDRQGGSKPKPDPDPRAKPDPGTKPDPESKPDPKTKPDPRIKPDPRAKPDPGTKPDPESKPDPRPWPADKPSPTDKPRPHGGADRPGGAGGRDPIGKGPQAGPGLDPRGAADGAGRVGDGQGRFGEAARPDRGAFPPDERSPRQLGWTQRTALVLQGGGALGAFQVGALKNLYARGLDPHIITGTSVGALNAAKVAEGRGVAGVTDLENLWLSLRGNDSIYVANPKVEDVAADTVEAWIDWAIELSASVLSGLPGFLPGALFDGPSLGGSWDEILSDLDAIESMNLQSPLRAQVANHIDPACVEASGIKLRLAAVARDHGDLRFFTETGDVETVDGRRIRGGRVDGPAVGSPDGGLLAPNLSDGVLASSAIPLFFEPRLTQGGEYYWDGAVKESTPIRKALDLGATNVVVVLTGPAPWSHEPTFRPGAYGLVIETVRQIADVEGVFGRAGDFQASVRINNQRSSWVKSRSRENDRNMSPNWTFFPVTGDIEIRIDDQEDNPDHCDLSPAPGKNLRLFIDGNGEVSGDVQGHAGDLLHARGNGDGNDVAISFRIVALSAGRSAYLGNHALLSITPVKRIMQVLGQMTSELAEGDMAVLDTLDTLSEVAAEVGEGEVLRSLRSFPLPRGIDGRPYFLPRYDVVDAPLVLGALTNFDPDDIRLNMKIGELAAKYTRVDFLDRREAVRGPQESRYPEDGDYRHPTQNPAISDERLEQRKRADILELLQDEIETLAAQANTEHRRAFLQRQLNELRRSRVVPSRHSPRLRREAQDSLVVPPPHDNQCVHDPCPTLLQRVRSLEASIERLQRELGAGGARKAQILDAIERQQRLLAAAREEYRRQCGRSR